MKRLIYWLIAVAAITLLLLPSGQAFAKSKWVAWPFGEDTLNTNWVADIETNGADQDCYAYSVDDGILKVWRREDVSGCQGKRIFVKVTNPDYSEIKVYLTVINSSNCFRSRIVADYIETGNEDQVYHQFALMSDIGNENCRDSVMSRVISYSSDRHIFDGFIKDSEGNNLPIIDNTYLLTVGVQKNSFDAEIMNDLLESYGKVKFEVPGGQLAPYEDHYLGVSCFSSQENSRGEVWFENPMVR